MNSADLFGEFGNDIPEILWQAAREYYKQTEQFDRTVCTGPIGEDGGILPATNQQRRLIEVNAIRTRQEIFNKMRMLGHSDDLIKRAFNVYVMSAEARQDTAEFNKGASK